MLSLGKTLYLWRQEKGFTQSQLSYRSGVSRPNLSAIENGGRDVTVQTLRRLATSLDIKAGVLVDGITPKAHLKKELSRSNLDRIARVLVGQSVKLEKHEDYIVQIVKPLIKRRLGLTVQYKRNLPRTARQEELALIKAKSYLTPDEFKSILNRVGKMLSVTK